MKTFSVVLLGAALLAAARPAWAAPAQVIVIRHGEKPPSGPDLDEQGYARAQALVGFFQNNPAVTQFGTPAAIYAMDPKGPNGSLRAIETVTPLAQALGLSINKDYKRKDIPQLVQDILSNSAYDGKTVLICWEHRVIPDIVDAFGWTSAPQSWAGSSFDRAWVLTFTGDRVTDFVDVPEHVLPGDSPD
ncbi:MAG: histidine phosphatase family protein [Elusimicrobia bacterium]|nr:histidine phosphatase family protein [Elusimicrobiota bacterium]